jgi:AraC-like DNA-binding protein
MIRAPLINNSMVQGLNQLVLEKGQKPSALYQEVNLPSQAMSQIGRLIPFHQEVQLLQTAANRLRMPTLGLNLASRQDLNCLGPLGAKVINHDTVLEALTYFQDNLHLSAEGVTIELSISNSNALLELKCKYPDIACNNLFQDHGIALGYMVLKSLCGDNWRPRAVYLPHGEVDALSNYYQYFNAPIAFDSNKLGIAFDPKVLSQPLPEKTKSLHTQLGNLVQDIQRQDFISLVKHLIGASISSENCSIELLACALGQSKRTVQRRLGDHDTTFQSLVDSVRSDQALPYMRNPFYSLADVASILGYSQLSAFSRSFKRWFDMSPQEWRRQNLELNS